MKVFLSYSSKDYIYASEIDNILGRYGVNLIRDDRDLRPLDNVTDFMRNIKRNEYALMLISSNYLTSKNCLFEFSEFMKVPDFHNRIIPVMLPNFKIDDSLYHVLKLAFKKHPSLNEVSLFSAFKGFFLNNGKGKMLIEQFESVWRYIERIKLLNYEELVLKEFKEIFSILKVYEEDIYTELKKVRKIKDDEERDIVLSRLLNKHPRSFTLWYFRAGLYSELNKYKKAIFYYEEYLSQFKENSEQIFGYYGLGVCYNKIKRYELAIEAHQKAISLDPKNWWKSYAGLGDVYVAQGNLNQAFEYYSKANSIINEPIVTHALGAIEYNRKNYESAAGFYSELVKSDPGNVNYYLNLKESLIRWGKRSEAGKVIEMAYSKFPENHKIITDYVIYKMQYLESEKELGKYLSLLHKSFEINPNYPKTKIYIAYLLFILDPGKTKIAISTLEDMMRLSVSEDEGKHIVKKLCEMYGSLNDTESINRTKAKYSKYL